MTKIKITSLAIVATIGVAAALLIQRQSEIQFQEKEALSREREGQLAEASKENQRLSNLVAQADTTVPDDHTAELSKLRSEAAALKKQTNAIAGQLEERPKAQPSGTTPDEPSHPPEYWEQLHEMSGAKGLDARNVASAMLEYALDHQSQFPTNIDQMASYFAKQNRSLSGTNQFEIVYHGSLDDLKGVSMGAVALVRDQQTWPGPDGKMMRVYGMAIGTGQLVGSDDNFKTWESQHIISPPKTGQ
jgi:hypothetical protein